MLDFKLISADSHLNEPPAAWERVQKEYGDRAPKVVKNPSGVAKGTWIITEGLPPIGCSHFSIGIVVGKDSGISEVDLEKHADTVQFMENFRFEDYPAAWEPSARIKAQDRDGVEAEVLFPSPARHFYGLTDEPLQRAIFHSYNAWLHEFCSYSPRRLVGLTPVSILDVEHAAEDIHDSAKLGFRGMLLPTRIRDGGFYEPQYEPIWAAAEETGMVINVHTNTIQGTPRTHFTGPRDRDPRKEPAGFAHKQAPAQQFVGALMFSGVFDRHPKLKVVCAEFDVGWVANLVQQVDYWFHRDSAYDTELNLNKLPPSEYYKRNIFFTYQDDRAGVLTTEVFGEDNFMWANDFPHGVTTWPYSRQTVDRNCKGIDPVVTRKINRENVNRVYQLGL